MTAAIAALSAIAASLPWPQYQQLLGQFLRLMRRHADTNKVQTWRGHVSMSRQSKPASPTRAKS